MQFDQLKKVKLADAKEPVQPDEDESLFQKEMSGITPLNQDKVDLVAERRNLRKQNRCKDKAGSQTRRQIDAAFAFSDEYQANLSYEGPMRYCRHDVPTHVLKQLRRGDFYPELVLDLHGITREAAKLELSALLYTAKKELVDCVSIVHGLGQGVLKSALPHYLVQHPDVRAFHQAPLEYGGQGALVVLIDITTGQETTGR